MPTSAAFHQDLPGLLDQKAPQGRKAYKDPLVRPALRVQQDLRAQRDHRDHRDHKDRRDPKGFKDLKGLLDHKGHQDPRDSRGRPALG